MVAWAASRISGKSTPGLVSMLIIPNTTGLPLAAFGVPSAALLAPPLLPDADVEVVAACVLAALELEVELLLELLPQAAAPMAATAHTPTSTPLLLNRSVIALPLISQRAQPEGRAVTVLRQLSTAEASLHSYPECMQVKET